MKRINNLAASTATKKKKWKIESDDEEVPREVAFQEAPLFVGTAIAVLDECSTTMWTRSGNKSAAVQRPKLMSIVLPNSGLSIGQPKAGPRVGVSTCDHCWL